MKFNNIHVGDFENTTGGDSTYIYGGGFMGLTDTDATIYENIDDSMKYILSLPKSSVVFFCNGSNYDDNIIVSWLLQHKYQQTSDRNVRKRFEALISFPEGKIYSLKIRTNNHFVVIRDISLLVQGSLAHVGKQLGCPTAKLVGTIDYDKPRGVGYRMDSIEREYLRHDVILLKEIVEKVMEMGNLSDFMTAGGFAFDEFKTSLYKTIHNKTDAEMYALKLHPKFRDFTKECFRHFFPKIVPLYDDDFRHAYRGGWCYNNTEGEIIDEHGLVLDVNSLYPSVLVHNFYPYGDPRYHDGNRIPNTDNQFIIDCVSQWGTTIDTSVPLCRCYIVHINARFTLKDRALPFIQIKASSQFCPTEYLKSSKGEEVDFWLCNVDLLTFFENYDVQWFEVLEGYDFNSWDGFFNEFINSHYEMKKNAPNKCVRQTAKIILNSSYGGFAERIHRSQGIAYLDADGVVKYKEKKDDTYPNRTYTAVAVFCTAYARRKTLTSALKVYDHFCYADTDSLHLRGITADEVKQIFDVDPVELGYWALESEWDLARFVRAKTYLERTIIADGKPLDEPKIDIKACGLTEEGKGMLKQDDDVFMKFTYGLTLKECKLMKHRVVNGCNLTRRDWRIRG